MLQKLNIIFLILAIISLVVLATFFVTMTRQQERTQQRLDLLEQQEGGGLPPKDNQQQNDVSRASDFINNLNIEFRDRVPHLVWDDDVSIYNVTVSEMEEPLPPPNPAPEVVKVLFSIFSEDTSIEKPYRIGVLPEGFSVIEGSLTQQFRETQYKVEVSGEVNENPVSGVTFFSFAKLNP